MNHTRPADAHGCKAAACVTSQQSSILRKKQAAKTHSHQQERKTHVAGRQQHAGKKEDEPFCGLARLFNDFLNYGGLSSLSPAPFMGSSCSVKWVTKENSPGLFR